MDLRVRAAGPADAPTLAGLDAEARSAVRPHRGGAELLEGCEPELRWQDLVADPAWHVLLAEIDTAPVGLCTVRRVSATATIHHLFVAEGAREVGLGEDLLAHAIEWATTEGATAIEATALPGDRSTKNLFERFGMKARALTVSRPLR
jgi:GNAT superfamily N-acetyltransferase